MKTLHCVSVYKGLRINVRTMEGGGHRCFLGCTRLLVCKKEKMVMCPGLVRWQGRSTSSGIFVLTVYWSKVTANIERDVSGRPTSTAEITLPPPRYTGENRYFHCSFGNCRPSCYLRYIAQRITLEIMLIFYFYIAANAYCYGYDGLINIIF